MNVVICSLWRNDVERNIRARMDHLFRKSSASHKVSLLWITGDNNDDTHAYLNLWTRHGLRDLTLLQFDTGITGEDVDARRRRSSTTANEMFRHIPADADVVILHESDLLTEFNIVDQLLANPLPCAGWPVMKLDGREVFYDIWAYRTLSGTPFGQQAAAMTGPPVVVGSFGSVWAVPAALVRGRAMNENCIVDLCQQWRNEGHTLLADPTIRVEQPHGLWADQC
jgi:hypothetical protein